LICWINPFWAGPFGSAFFIANHKKPRGYFPSPPLDLGGSALKHLGPSVNQKGSSAEQKGPTSEQKGANAEQKGASLNQMAHRRSN